MRLIKVRALAGVLVVAGSVISAQAQKVYVADNGTRSVNSGWNVKVFENGVHKYIIGDNEGVTFSPRSVGYDSTGAVYVMHLSPTPSNLGCRTLCQYLGAPMGMVDSGRGSGIRSVPRFKLALSFYGGVHARDSRALELIQAFYIQKTLT